MNSRKTQGDKTKLRLKFNARQKNSKIFGFSKCLMQVIGDIFYPALRKIRAYSNLQMTNVVLQIDKVVNKNSISPEH